MTLNKPLGAALLISGTSIGAGMLALPIVTQHFGFIPSMLLLVVCWGFMLASALILLEVNLWFPPETNLVSMASKTLGEPGQIIAWLCYLLLLYSLMAAYLSGANQLTLSVSHSVFNSHSKPWLGAMILIIGFASVIYLRTAVIDYLNRLLIGLMMISYLIIIVSLTTKTHLPQLSTMKFHGIWLTTTVVLTAFGFHIIIPSLRNYLAENVTSLRKAILTGFSLPLIIYLIWELLILTGSSGPGSSNLAPALTSSLLHYQPGISATSTLINITKLFAILAITTSFIGVSLSLFDFWADGLSIRKNRLGKSSIAIITFAPPLIYALAYPHGFITALRCAGFFVAILLGILPSLMAYRGRYHHHYPSQHYRVMGGKFTLCITLLFYAAILVMTSLSGIQTT